jgi:hypothetical protein
MDCALIPFLCNTLTASIYPLKINEYLAAGKPVVSTGFSDDIRSFADCIYLAENPGDFVRLVGEALAENDPEKTRRRIEVAESNTWEARIRQLQDIVTSYKSNPQPTRHPITNHSITHSLTINEGAQNRTHSLPAADRAHDARFHHTRPAGHFSESAVCLSLKRTR